DIFRRIIGHELFQDVTPVLASTPKTKGQKFWICKRTFDDDYPTMVECSACKYWFHGICINVDVNAIRVDDLWMCASCLKIGRTVFLRHAVL
ncbi:unnamed protein product, partial [Allacma fusca]